MPDFITHALFAREACPSLRGTDAEPWLILGAQGPDPFFYAAPLPCQDDHGFNGLGHRLHSEQTDAFLRSLSHWQRFLEGQDRARGRAYAAGFLCHYALDTECHPYVYAQAGYAFNGAPEKASHTHNHKFLESAVDVLLYAKKEGGEARRLALWKLLPDQPFEALESFYERALRVFYGFDGYTLGDFYRTVQDMRHAQRILYDPLGLKGALLRGIGRLTGRKRMPYVGKPLYDAYARLVAHGVDYLNESHTGWSHPLQAASISEASFEDLYDAALVRARTYLGRMQRLDDGSSEEADWTLVEGYSYDSKLVWNEEKNRVKASGDGLLDGVLGQIKTGRS